MANDRNRAKRARNQALKVDTLREARIKSGVEEELRNLKYGYTISDGAITNDHQGDATTDNRVLAPNAVSTSKILNNAVSTSKIGDGEVSNSKIGSEEIRDTRVNIDFKDGAQGDYCMRSIARDPSWASRGTELRSASANHVHSTSFKSLSREERRYYIALADKIAARKSNDPAYVELREMVLFFFRLQADDIDVTAKERERIIDEHPEGDSLEHELYMQHDYVYFAEHELRENPRYRIIAKKDKHIGDIARNMDDVVELSEHFALSHELHHDGTLKEQHKASYNRDTS